MLNLTIHDSFVKELPAGVIESNTRRQVFEACYSFVTPKKVPYGKVIHVSDQMATELGFSDKDILSEEFKNMVTGNEVLANTTPYAMCYGGHQFGHWAGQLGDGRAINLFELEHQQKTWVLQLKGAGETPYSRTADGLAVLRSSIREYLCSEAMYHLGIPTTRALSIALSGDSVLRDVLYNGNAAYEKGAIVCRTAPSFLRFGNYQLLAARGDTKTLKILVDYTIKHHFKHLQIGLKESYISFFEEVSKKSLKMVIDWQRVGFVHGVMNTDNMSILGLTIDYGPYGWLEGYDENWTPNTTDNTNKRYRYGSQPEIVLWNLYQLANALYLLIDEAEPLEKILNNYQSDFTVAYSKMMCNKLGLETENKSDGILIADLEKALQLTETDMTIFYRLLATVSKNDTTVIALDKIDKAFYNPKEIKGDILLEWQQWFDTYLNRLQYEIFSDDVRKDKMNAVNPKYVLRNYMAQLAIDAADKSDYTLLNELYVLLKNPYDEQSEYEKWFSKRPEWARNKVGCSMLSCSS